MIDPRTLANRCKPRMVSEHVVLQHWASEHLMSEHWAPERRFA
jgi:hypothetical protein